MMRKDKRRYEKIIRTMEIDNIKLKHEIKKKDGVIERAQRRGSQRFLSDPLIFDNTIKENKSEARLEDEFANEGKFSIFIQYRNQVSTKEC